LNLQTDNPLQENGGGWGGGKLSDGFTYFLGEHRLAPHSPHIISSARRLVDGTDTCLQEL